MPDLASVRREQRADSIFTAALQLPPGERERFARDACRSDPQLLEAVLRLLRDFENLTSFLENPPSIVRGMTARILTIGQVLCERFVIRKYLGAGGMGQVYEAEYLTLDERVALKTLLPSLAGDPSFVTRFHNEIKAARKVSHRNVCRIHDLFTHVAPPGETGGPVSFFTMQLLEGETLAARLTGGRKVPLTETLAIASGIAEAIDEIHANGIVHRDLKPGNVILAGGLDGEKPVVTDFGLAKALVDPSSNELELTRTGDVIGSAPYMAPEQWLNEPIVPATDIFAFGVMLYEMVAGCRPWPDEALVRSAIRRVTETPPPPSRHVPDLPGHCSDVIMACLRRAPADRPASGREVWAALEGRSAIQVQTDRVPPPRSAISRRWLVGGAAVFGAVSLFEAVRRIYKWQSIGPSKQSSSPAREVTVLVAPFEYPVGETSFEMIAPVLRAQLQQSPHVVCLSGDDVANALARMGRPPRVTRERGAVQFISVDSQLLREVGFRAGAAALIFGSVSMLRGEPSVQVAIEKIVSPAVHEDIGTRTFSAGSLSDLPQVASHVANWVRETLGENEEQLARNSRPASDITAQKWQALLEYSNAESLRAAGDMPGSISALRTALRIEPDFPLACMRLADTLRTVGQTDEALVYWGRAAELARKRSLTDRESLRIQGLFSLDTGDSAAAERIFEEFTHRFRNDYRGHFYLAGAVERQGRLEQALTILEVAHRENPLSTAVALARVKALARLRRLDEAEGELRQARSIGPDPWHDQHEMHIAFLRRDYRRAWHAIGNLEKSPDAQRRSAAPALAACLLSECGDDQRAINVLEHGKRADRADAEAQMLNESYARKCLSQAALLLRMADSGRACSACDEALEINSQPHIALVAAGLFARAGKIDKALQLLRSVNRLPHYPLYDQLRAAAAGEIELARHRSQRSTVPTNHVVAVEGDVDACYLRARIADATHRGIEAVQQYQAIARSPELYWFEPNNHEPGLFRFSLEQVSGSDAASGESRQSAATTLAGLTAAGASLS